MNENPHLGHRERLRSEFLKRGSNKKMPPEKVLEMLLFYCISRRDTAPIARKMLEKYGSIQAVLKAPIKELCKFDYINENAAVLLKLTECISNSYFSKTPEVKPRFQSIDEIGEFVAKKFFDCDEERAGAMLMDHHGKALKFSFIGEGDVGSVGISMRNLLHICLDSDATMIVLAHNHPSGVALPSPLDISATERMAVTLSQASIKLLDHVIVGKNDYISMAQSAEYAHIFNDGFKKL